MQNIRKQGYSEKYSAGMADDSGLRHPPSHRIFVEMGLFSELYKTEVSEYIAAKGSGRGWKTFVTGSPQAAPLLHFQPV